MCICIWTDREDLLEATGQQGRVVVSCGRAFFLGKIEDALTNSGYLDIYEER